MPDGKLYRGNFVKGKRNGYGATYDKDGKLLRSGNYENDKLFGEGEMNYDNGDRYVGYFQNGIKHGEGKYTTSNGDVF